MHAVHIIKKSASPSSINLIPNEKNLMNVFQGALRVNFNSASYSTLVGQHVELAEEKSKATHLKTTTNLVDKNKTRHRG